MTASQPQDLPTLFLQGLNAADVEAVVSLYEPNGVVASTPAEARHGREAIRSMVTGFLAQRPVFALQDSEVTQADDVALIRARWMVTTTDAGGATTTMRVAPTLVARRQADGQWLVVIDRPLMDS